MVVFRPFKHEVIGNNVCTAGGKVLEMFKPWIAMIESIDLSSLGGVFQEPQLADFSTNKQSLYDNVSDLLLGCQAVAGPLADEWAEVRGQALEERLEYVRQCARAFETNSSHIVFSLQLLQESVQTTENVCPPSFATALLKHCQGTLVSASPMALIKKRRPTLPAGSSSGWPGFTSD